MSNIIGIVITLLVFAGFLYLVFTSNKSKVSTDKNDLIVDDDDVVSLETIIQDVKEIFAKRLRVNIWDENLRRDELEKRKRDLAKLRFSLNNASCGDAKARQDLKNRIMVILTSREYGYCLDRGSQINKIVPFNDLRQLTMRQKHEIIMHLYRKKYATGGLEHFIEDFNLCQKKEGADGREYYKVTKEQIDDAMKVIFSGRSSLGDDVALSNTDELEIVTQLIYSSYQGFGAIDSMYYMAIDEIDCGVSGIPVGGFDIAVSNKNGKEIRHSYQSIWIVYHGNNISLDYLSFASEQEFVRVCDNIYRCNAPETLSQTKGCIVSTMPDGSRIAVTRPPVAENWAFFLRKFTAGSAAPIPARLVSDENNYVPLNIIRWCLKAEQNMIVTGQAGTGKTTFLKAIMRYIDTTLNIRVVELAFELSLRFIYPDLNILTAQATESCSTTEIMNWDKKANAAMTILGEIAMADQAAQYIETCQVNSRLGLATHHAGTTDELMEALGGNLTQLGLYKDKNDAVRAVAKAVKINCHLAITNTGHRHIAFIDEIVPSGKEAFPSETEDYADASEQDKFFADGRKYFKDMTNPRTYTVNRLCHWSDEGGVPHFVIDNPPSQRFLDEVAQKLPESLQKEFHEDMAMMLKAYKKPNGKKEEAWISKVISA